MENNVLAAVLDVWTAIMTWMVTSFNQITPIFYSSETGLTFLGVLGSGGLAVGVILLLLGIVQGFLRFRS